MKVERQRLPVFTHALLGQLKKGWAHWERYCLLVAQENHDQLDVTAHREAALLALARLVDRHKDARGMFEYLDFVENNPRLFSGVDYRVVQERACTFRRDLHGKRALIHRIRTLRDKHLAHLDQGVVFGKKKAEDHLVDDRDVPQLFSLLESGLSWFGERLPQI